MSNPVSFEDLSLADGELFHDYKGVAYTMPEPLAPLADTHGHLTSFRELDPAVTLVRAALAGVRLLVVPIDPIDDVPRRWESVPALLSWLDEQIERARAGLAVCAEHGFVPPAFEGYDVPDLLDNVRIVAGAHPYGAEKFDDEVMARLRELLASPRCVGVGEFGLDYGPSSTVPYPVQEEVFRTHLRLAGELGLPVQLHIRDAANDVRCGAHRDAARILEEEGVPEAGCDLHCFTSGIKVLEGFTRLDCRIAFGATSSRRPTAPTWRRCPCAARSASPRWSASPPRLSPTCARRAGAARVRRPTTPSGATPARSSRDSGGPSRHPFGFRPHFSASLGCRPALMSAGKKCGRFCVPGESSARAVSASAHKCAHRVRSGPHS